MVRPVNKLDEQHSINESRIIYTLLYRPVLSAGWYCNLRTAGEIGLRSSFPHEPDMLRPTHGQ